MSSLVSRGLLGWVVIAVAVSAGALLPPAAASSVPVPLDVYESIDALMQNKVGDLLSQKNADGVVIARGSYSPDFRMVNDSTYAVTFFRYRAEKDSAKVERLLLTVSRGADKRWSVTKEEVQDTYDGLHRSVREEDEFYRFDKFAFDRYGMKVTATNGSFYKTSFMGKPSSFTLMADDLKYEYAPPKNLNLGYYERYKQVMMKEYPQYFVFDPEMVFANGDAASCEEILQTAFTGLKKVSKGETASKLQHQYDDMFTDWTKNLKDNGFFAFRRPYPPDRKTWNLAVRQTGTEAKGVWIDYDNYEPWDLRFGAVVPSGGGAAYPQEIFGYYSEDVTKGTPSLTDLERRPDSDARDFDLDSLTGMVEVGLDNEDGLTGDLTYGMTIKQPLRELPFRISRMRRPGDEQRETKNPKMTISFVQDGDGNELSWVKLGSASALVVFPKPLPAGTKVTLRMKFTNTDSIYRVNPSYAMMDRGGWLPFVRFTDPIEKFDLTVKVRSKYRVLGVGQKLSDETSGGINTTRWASDRPVSFPTIIYGDYIDDGPKIKATKIDGSEIPVRVYVDKVSTHTLAESRTVQSMGDVEDRVARAAEGARGIRGKQLGAIADQAVNALNLYRAIWGQDYKFAKLDLVADPLGAFYGQAPASIIYLGFGVFRGEGAVAGGGMFDGGADIAKFNKDVVAHETGHQWWGSLIGNANNRNYWFIESLTEYSAALFVENVRGRKAYEEKVADWRRGLMKFELLSSVEDSSALWGGENPGAAYQYNVYFKGPYAFHVLRQTFGDEKFFKFLKDLAAEFAEKQIVTGDIQQVAERNFGGTMGWFFDQWFRVAGLPQYALFYNIRQTEDGKWLVEGKIKQRVLAGKSETELPGVYFRALAPLTFVTADGKEFKSSKPLLVEAAETPFKLKLAQKPAQVFFNKDGEILAHDVLVNQSW